MGPLYQGKRGVYYAAMKGTPQSIIGIMGSIQATETELERARTMGAAVAKEGWVTLTGGEHRGVMHAAAEGAANAGGLTVGILPGNRSHGVSPHIHLPIFTGIGSARNITNVLTSQVVVVVSTLTPGTLLEVTAAALAGVPLVFFGPTESEVTFMQAHRARCVVANTPEEAIEACKAFLAA